MYTGTSERGQLHSYVNEPSLGHRGHCSGPSPLWAPQDCGIHGKRHCVGSVLIKALLKMASSFLKGLELCSGSQGTPPQQPNPPPRWGSEKHLLSTEHPIFFDRIYRFLRWHQWQKTCRPVQETNTSSIRGLGRCPGGGHGNPLQCSCLENPHGQRSLVGYSP